MITVQAFYKHFYLSLVGQTCSKINPINTPLIGSITFKPYLALEHIIIPRQNKYSELLSDWFQVTTNTSRKTICLPHYCQEKQYITKADFCG